MVTVRAAGPPAILLGGRGTALVVARSLAAAGVEVHAVGGERDPVRYSRSCTRYTSLPEGRDTQAAWIDWLRRDAPRGALLIACADEGVELVSREREELTGLGFRMTEGNPATALAMLDKHATYLLGQQAGVRVPKVVPLTSMGDVETAASVVGFPCAVKPTLAHVYARERSGKFLHAASEPELRAVAKELLSTNLSMMISELIPGPDDAFVSYIGYYGAGGREIAGFANQKLRQYPVGGGLDTYTVNGVDDEAQRVAAIFAQGIGLEGMAEIELKRDSRTGELVLIECNNRFTVHVRAVEFDFPLYAYCRAVAPSGSWTRRRRRPRPYLWDPIADYRAFLTYRRRQTLSLPGWLWSLRRRKECHVFRWDDPLPTARYAYDVVRRPASNLLRRLAAREPAPAPEGDQHELVQRPS